MFAGLDDIDWAAMEHAYGPAIEIPDLLRGLLSEDAASREAALDGMYGSVHHQGDVYECTAACVPFLLEAVADPLTPDRGAILELLASIADAGGDLPEEADEEASWCRNSRLAYRATLVGYPIFLELLADPDPHVRRQAPAALLACSERAARTLAALPERLAVEPDPRIRIALVEAVGDLGTRAAAGRLATLDATAVGPWLGGLIRHTDPAVRLAALAQLARCAPAALPPDVVPIALDAVREVYGDGPADTAGTPVDVPVFTSPPETLVGAVRQMREHNDAGRRAPWMSDLLYALHGALGDRVADRIELAGALLRAADWERGIVAVRNASALMRGWRGRYDDLVAGIGAQLAHPDRRLSAAAADALENLHQLAAPAADDLARYLDASPREGGSPSYSDAPYPWLIVWGHGLPTMGPVLTALSRLGDPRALPAVRWALERDVPPLDIGSAVVDLGAAAADLVPLIRRRLRDLPRVDGDDSWHSGLAYALIGLGEAAPLVPDLVARLRRDDGDTSVVDVLGRIGPPATAAGGVLRRLLRHSDPPVALAAARALWRIDPDPALVLPVFTRQLVSSDGHAATAAEGIAELGPAAAPVVDRLRQLLAGSSGWEQLHAAGALWRAVGDAETALPVLLESWQSNVYTRQPVARYVTEMGLAAATAAPALRDELARVRRHTYREYSSGSHDIPEDEELLRACAEALTRVTA